MLFFVAVFAFFCAAADAKPSPEDPLVRQYSGGPGGVESYIIGGKNALPGAWPWQLSLQYLYGTWQHICGATLLSTTRGLCAAHCVIGTPASSLRVVAGLLDRSDTSGTQAAVLSSYRMHALYDENSFVNDISVLWFSTSIATNDFTIMAATLPPNNNNDFSGATCVLTGWGRVDHDPNSTLPNVLQQVNMPIITSSSCSNLMSGIAGTVITGNHICAYDNSHASCQGDSGGPMNCPGSAGYVVAGVTSWGIGSGSVACITSYPSVYTRTSAYLAWIQSNS